MVFAKVPKFSIKDVPVEHKDVPVKHSRTGWG